MNDSTWPKDVAPAKLFELPDVDPNDSADVTFGRGLEAAEIAQAITRRSARYVLDLLESGRWAEVWPAVVSPQRDTARGKRHCALRLRAV